MDLRVQFDTILLILEETWVLAETITASPGSSPILASSSINPNHWREWVGVFLKEDCASRVIKVLSSNMLDFTIPDSEQVLWKPPFFFHITVPHIISSMYGLLKQLRSFWHLQSTNTNMCSLTCRGLHYCHLKIRWDLGFSDEVEIQWGSIT